MKDLLNSIKVTLIKLEGDQAILKSPQISKIPFPKDKLPANLKEGDDFYLSAHKSIKQKNSKEIAVHLLEEILNGEQKGEEEQE